jgi:hypothetical protein
MNRGFALKIALIVVGLLFLALIYPMVLFMQREPALSMMLSLYVTLGVFLLVAVRNPPANRDVILFTAWSSFAHAVVMGYQSLLGMVARGELFGVAALVVIGVVLLVLVPGKEGAAHVSAQPLPVASQS